MAFGKNQLTEMLKRIVRPMRRQLRSYEGLQLLLVCFMLLVGVQTVLTLWWSKGIHPAELVDGGYLEYVFAYWVAHKLFFLGLAAFVVFLLTFDLGARTYHRFFKAMPLIERNRRKRYMKRVLRYTLTVAVVGELVVVLPMLHLQYEDSLLWLASLVPVPMTILTYIALFGYEVRQMRQVRPLSKSTFSSKDWNAASLGQEPDEARDEVGIYEAKYAKSPMSGDTIQFIESGTEDAVWNGNRMFIQDVAELMHVDSASVTLFDRTTDAVRHALEEVVRNLRAPGKESVSVMTTDCEYDSVRDVLNELEDQGQIKIQRVQIWDVIWNGPANLNVRSLIENGITKGPDVICMSHVAFQSGYTFPIRELIEYSSTHLEEPPIWIIDGAQALGNIFVDPEVLNETHYYCGCGHKWLCGKPTLGILYRNPIMTKDFQLFASSRSLSTVDEVGLSGTVNIEAHVSANYMVREMLVVGTENIANHNRTLAQLLARLVRLDGVLVPVSSLPTNGIVTLVGDEAGRVHRGLRRDGITTLPMAELNALRICCHYYHSENDVYELVKKILEAVE